MDLKGKTAVVTGSATGIGAACAVMFAERGANVVVNYSKSQAEAEDTVSKVTAAGAGALLVKADCADEAAVASMMI
jgi:NAD(P)-dependent dehydrogenase (short-subunit alcohol dehydrogenase family)